MSVLKDLYNGKIYPCEVIVPQEEEYRQMSVQMEKLREYFAEKQPQEDKEKFEEWNRLILETGHMEEYANFAYGFRLAVMLMADVLTGTNESEK